MGLKWTMWRTSYLRNLFSTIQISRVLVAVVKASQYRKMKWHVHSLNHYCSGTWSHYCRFYSFPLKWIDQCTAPQKSRKINWLIFYSSKLITKSCIQIQANIDPFSFLSNNSMDFKTSAWYNLLLRVWRLLSTSFRPYS